jgi:hypothetical protein
LGQVQREEHRRGGKRPTGRTGYWSKRPPPTKDIPGVVHENSTVYMSDNVDVDKHASVGPDHRPLEGLRECLCDGRGALPVFWIVFSLARVVYYGLLWALVIDYDIL